MSKPRFWRLQLLVGLLVLVSGTLILVGSVRLSNLFATVFLRTAVAQTGVIERAYVGKGIMARSEFTVKAPSDGVVTLLVADSQRVRTGQIVAEIREDVQPHIEDALKHLDRKIADLDRESQVIATDFRRRLDQLQRSIEQFEAELSSALTAGRSDFANELTRNLGQLRHDHVTLDAEFAHVRASREAERQALQMERASLLASTAVVAAVVRAELPGVVSFAHDGYEDQLTPGQAPDSLWALLDRPTTLQTTQDGKKVQAGSTLFRLIDNFQSNVFVQFDVPPDMSQGQSVWLRWAGIDPPGIRARVQSVHSREKSVGVWFSIDVYQDAFGTLRELGLVTVVTNRVQGVVLPKSVIGQRGERQGLYLVADGSPIFRPVNVLAADDERIVVDHVPVGTRVITNPKRLFMAQR